MSTFTKNRVIAKIKNTNYPKLPKSTKKTGPQPNYMAIGLCLVAVMAITSSAVATDNPLVFMDITNNDDISGQVVIELFPDDAPITVENFLSYVNTDFYDSLIFHRVVGDFVIQGGGFDPNLTQMPTNDPIINESFNGLSNLRGTIAMARTFDPNSATSQFYINLTDDNTSLDYQDQDNVGYCVFGEVTAGMDVIDAIAATPTHSRNGFQDVPVTNVIITRAFPEFEMVVEVPETTVAGQPTEATMTFYLAQTDPNDPDRTFTGKLFMSDDPNFVADDSQATYLDVFTEWLTVVSQTEHTKTITFDAPAEAGTYYSGAMLTNSNTIYPFKGIGTASQTISFEVLPSSPDLIVSDFEQSQIQVWIDEQIELPIEIENIGGTDTEAAEGIQVRVYYSKSAEFSTSDPCNAELATLNVDSLAAGDSYSETLNINPPTEAGIYYLTAVVDDANSVLEADETNNIGNTIELTVRDDQETTITVDKIEEFLTTAGERLILTYSGPGRAELLAWQRPNGQITETVKLTIVAGNAASSVRLINNTTYGNIDLQEIVLDGSLRNLIYDGRAEAITATEGTIGVIASATLGQVERIDTGNYIWSNLDADELGDPELPDGQYADFNTAGFTNISIAGDAQGVRFLQNGSRNRYNQIDVGGIVTNCRFFGMSVNSLTVANKQDENIAIDQCILDCGEMGGSLGQITVEAGDIAGSTFTAGRYIGTIELGDGNLDGCTIEVTENVGSILNVMVGDSSQSESEKGNIVNTAINAGWLIRRVHADGDIDANSSIDASGLFSSMIDRVSCRGDFSGRVFTILLNNLLAGYDRLGNKVTEQKQKEYYSGSDISGSISCYFRLGHASATGKIKNASFQSDAGSIISLLAEDGFEDSSVQANRGLVYRVMVGYENGQRGIIVNSNADVSGSIRTYYLGRLYYTGTIDDNMTLPSRRGPIVDDSR